jgi:hypothetical protein
MREELAWNSRGVLNPISTPTGMKRAPYIVTLRELVERFATSPERCKILKGFLEYRKELRLIGIVEGFHWIDGSFVEEIEVLEGRPPNDIDVVTFYKVPAGETQETLFNKNPLLFPMNDEEKAKLKEIFPVDGSMSSLDAKQRPLIKQVIFWYSLLSHRRDQTWKGFLQTELDGKDDASVRTLLDSLAEKNTEMVDED